MPRQRHYYGFNHLHYLTAATYRRARIFDSDRFRSHFVKTLAELRMSLGFKILGSVLMPERLHLLIWPSERTPPRSCKASRSGRLVKHARYYWLLLAEGHLSRRLFGSLLRMIAALPLPDS